MVSIGRAPLQRPALPAQLSLNPGYLPTKTCLASLPSPSGVTSTLLPCELLVPGLKASPKQLLEALLSGFRELLAFVLQTLWPGHIKRTHNAPRFGGGTLEALTKMGFLGVRST